MKPTVYRYDCARSFLQSCYEEVKSTQALSLRDWAQEMGFESPAFLLDVLRKRRMLKLKHVDLLAQKLSLDLREKTYLKTLILLERASDEQKTYYQDVISSLRPQDTFVNSDGGLFSHWLNVVIFVQSQMSEFVTPEGIRDSLKSDVPLKTVEDSLELLVNNRLLDKTAEGYRSLYRQGVTTPNDVSIASSHTYYSQVLAKAQSAIAMDVSEREFQCFALGMKKENLGKAKDLIRKLRKEIGELEEERGDLVYQFNFNGFPMAEIKRDAERMFSVPGQAS